MRCNDIINSYLEQPDSYPSVLVRIHMLICPACREEIRRLQKTFTFAGMDSPYRIPFDLTSVIMQKITASEHAYERNDSSMRWIFTGLIILGSIFMVSYSDSLIWLRDRFGRGIEIPLNIVLGLVITLYAASYIATHMDNLKRLADIIHHKMH